MKLVDGFWVWRWWWGQSYLSEEMRVGEAAALDMRWIPSLWVFVLLHDVCGCTIVVYAKVLGWESLDGSLSVSSMMQYKGTWRLGSLGGEECCWGCFLRCIIQGLLLRVLSLGTCIGSFGGVGVVGWGAGLFEWYE